MRLSSDATAMLLLPLFPLAKSLQVDCRLAHLADGRQRITRTGLLGDPLLFVGDDFKQQLLVLCRRHVLFHMLFVSTVVELFAGLRVELLPRPLSDGTVELDMRRIELRLARLQRTVEALDQPCNFVAI